MKVFLTERQQSVYDVLLVASQSDTGITAEQIAEQIGIKQKRVVDTLSELRRLGIDINRKRRGARSVYTYWLAVDLEDQPARYAGTDGEALWKSTKAVSEVLTQRARIEAPTFKFNRVIGIVAIADLHIGHPHLNYDAVDHLIDQIAKTPDLYVIALGDLIDNSVNALAPRGALNIVDKQAQLEMVEYRFKKIKDRVLWLSEGNHELRSYLSDHFYPTKYLSEQFDAFYGRNGSAFYVEMPCRKLKFYCRHKAHGYSQYNPFQPNTRCILFDTADDAQDADAVITAHKHVSGIANYKVAGKDRYMAVCGTGILYDSYADRIGLSSGMSSFPVFVIRPDGGIHLHRRFLDGIADLHALQQLAISECTKTEIEDPDVLDGDNREESHEKH